MMEVEKTVVNNHYNKGNTNQQVSKNKNTNNNDIETGGQQQQQQQQPSEEEIIKGTDTASNTNQSQSGIVSVGTQQEVANNNNNDNVATTTNTTTTNTMMAFDDTKAETKVVFGLKLILLIILTACTIGVALGVYYYIQKGEVDEFNNRFNDGAEKVLTAIGSSLYLSLGALDSFVVDTVSFTTHNGNNNDNNNDNKIEEWPFVATPNFAVRASKLRALSHAFIIIQYNIVNGYERKQWEEFSIKNDEWVNEAINVQKTDKNYHGILLDEYKPYPSIYDNNCNSTEPCNSTSPGPYAVLWQSYPMVPSTSYPPYNWDALAYSPFIAAAEEVLDNARVVIRCSNLPDPSDTAAIEEAEWTNYWAKDYLREDANPAEPQIEVYYPMTLEAAKVVSQDDISNKTVVGVLAPSIYWRELMTEILPPGPGGVDAVFEFGDSIFTYNIDGPKATYLGQGDHHDPRFDKLQRKAKLLDLASPRSSYTGLPLSDLMADYTIYIYPSSAMEDHFTTTDPVTFTVLTVIIFAFTSVVFLIYDRCVERRQRKVLHTAIQSRENVSLLETMVKERTSKLEASNMKLEEANRKVVQASALQLQHFACMSHEIRTPLNCIIGLSSLMEESDLNPMQRDSMRMITTSGDLLRTIVDDVLDYSKLESGNVDINIKRSNLQQTLSSVVHSIEMRGLATDVAVDTVYDPLIPEFMKTDTRRLQQILYNLLGNAVKFSKRGGAVELSASIASPAPNCGCKNGYSPPRPDSDCGEEFKTPDPPIVNSDKVLRFVIKDHGKGITEEDYPKIFQPFIQTGEEADNENIYGGTGLGLPITVKLIHGLGGSIAVESKKGSWTKFTVDLPFHDDVVDKIALASGLKTTKVLFISDDPQKSQRVVDILQTYQVSYDKFISMEDMLTKFDAETYPAADQPCICLVHETLFDKEKFDLLLSHVPAVILVTFGPEFLVNDANGHHRSLTKILPSALISSLASIIKPLRRKSISTPDKKGSFSFDSSAPYLSLRYLIAEDNVVNQKVLRRILNKLGVKNLEIVDNGQKAVDREAEKEFDIILMDMQMPIMDGIDACRLINDRRGGHRKPKIVFVSAHVQDSFKLECLKAGSAGFLAKPCNIQSVEECLRKLFPPSGDQDQTEFNV